MGSKAQQDEQFDAANQAALHAAGFRPWTGKRLLSLPAWRGPVFDRHGKGFSLCVYAVTAIAPDRSTSVQAWLSLEPAKGKPDGERIMVGSVAEIIAKARSLFPEGVKPAPDSAARPPAGTLHALLLAEPVKTAIDWASLA